MASVLCAPSETADGTAAGEACEQIRHNGSLSIGGDNITAVAGGAVAVRLLDLAELDLVHDLLVVVHI